MIDLLSFVPPHDLKPIVPKYLMFCHPILNDDPHTTLVLDNLNQNRTYTVHYYDPFSGGYFEPMDFEPENCSLGSGDEGFLRLYHPELTWSRPILFFELYDTGISRVRSTQTSTAMADVNAMHSLEGAQSAMSVEESTASMIRIFPNPTREIINVEMGSEMSGTYEIFNSVGAGRNNHDFFSTFHTNIRRVHLAYSKW